MTDLDYLLALGLTIEEVAARAGRAPEAIRYELARSHGQETPKP